MLTFLEAFERYGRHSMDVAEAMGVDEPVAYNLIASRVAGADRREPSVMTLSRYHQSREMLRQIRMQKRGVSR
ncbi:hypothetical protein ASG25_10765 [Rhizobium sp. Leaf384]|uniref:hypothetical protein n=1 Tax=Rhizobium sp. Leaf384 TaxID=1736358 RepID=UPI0007123C13|nr:hypothetical protein [Rhizobium sp. Leaf384]KQS79059.1 hypothetical protein ASG25_10765 [Rhizobium sp. Leaf384]